ncbi:Elongation factor 1-beta 1 [Capsicum annuum]|nr:Elongation factor 1-beta 1 [Capsicum annuum]KAF3677884.1 Elongation factor 1-beta 1 [Capsicum annuum]
MDFSGYISGVYASHSRVVREKVWWELASMRGLLSAVGVRFGSQAAIAPAAPAKEAAKPSNDNDDDDYIDLFREETKEAKKAAEASEAAEAFTKNKDSGKLPIFKDVKPWDDETGMNKLEESVRSFDVEGLL